MKYLLKKELDKIRQLIENLKTQFKENDIRISFFDGYFSIIKHYLNFYLLIESEFILNNYKFIYDVSEIENGGMDYHIQCHKNILNNQLIINSWSNFELCITVLADSILQISEKENLLNHQYNEVLSILKNITLNQKQTSQLNKLKKKNIIHTPITNRYSKLFKLASQGYNKTRNMKNDRLFLEFFGKLRNCIHSNYVYYGDEYKYEYKGVIFTFKNSELIHQSEQYECLLIQLSMELKDIFQTLIQNISFQSLIKDPSFHLFGYQIKNKFI